MTLREARRERGFTKVDTCVLLGVSLPTYSLWEKGVGRPTPENEAKLIATFGELEWPNRNGGA